MKKSAAFDAQPRLVDLRRFVFKHIELIARNFSLFRVAVLSHTTDIRRWIDRYNIGYYIYNIRQHVRQMIVLTTPCVVQGRAHAMSRAR